MDDLDLVLRIRTNADGSAQIISAQTQAIRGLGNAAEQSGQSVAALGNHTSVASARLSVGMTASASASQIAARVMHASTGSMTAGMSGVATTAQNSAASVNASLAAMSSSARASMGSMTESMMHSLRSIDSNIQTLNQRLITNQTTLQQHSSTVRQTAGSYSELTNALKTYIGFQGVKNTIELADSMALLDARVKNATGSQNDYNIANTRLTKIALDTHSALAANDQLFARINKSVESMGGSIDTTLALTKTLNQGLQESGSATAEANSFVLQFSQSMASGVVRGDEFNSMMENGSRLVDALTKSLGVSKGELRQMAEEGKLTSAVVVNAILSESKAIDDEYKKLPLTVGRSFEDIHTEFSVFIKDINDSTGATSALANKLESVAGAIHSLTNMINPADSLQGRIDVLNRQIGKKYQDILDKKNGAGFSINGFSPGGDVVTETEVNDLISLIKNRDKLNEILQKQNDLHNKETQALKDKSSTLLGVTQAEIAYLDALQKRQTAEQAAGTNIDKKTGIKIDTYDANQLDSRVKNALKSDYKDMIIDVAIKGHVDPSLMLAMAAVESNSGKMMGDLSSKAHGLFQFTQKTAEGIAKITGDSVTDILNKPVANAKATVALLAENARELTKFGVESNSATLAASHNMYPAGVAKGWVEANAETRAYVLNVVKVQAAIKNSENAQLSLNATYQQAETPLEKYQAALTEINRLDGLGKLSAAGKQQMMTDALASYEKQTQVVVEAVTAAEKYLKAEMDIDAQLTAGNITQAGAIEKLTQAHKAYDDATGASDRYKEALKQQNEIEKQLENYRLAARDSSQIYIDELNKLVAVYNSVENAGNKLMSVDTFSNTLGGLQDTKARSDANTPEAKALADYNKILDDTIGKTNQLGATNSAVFDSALGGVSALVGAFTNYTNQLAANANALNNLAAAKDAQISAVTGTEAEKAAKSLEINKKYQGDVAKMQDANRKTELDGIRQTVSATSKMFDDKSHARKAFNAIEMTMSAMEAANAISAAVSSLASTQALGTAKAAAGVANQASEGDPYTAFARVAAMIALMASIGFSVGGSGAATPPAATGNATTGTVLGDKTAQSQSVQNIVTTLNDIHAKEYLVLQDINFSMKDLGNSITAAVTGIFQRGDLATPDLQPNTSDIWVTTTNEVSQNILRGAGTTIGKLMDGYTLRLQQFLETKTTESGWIFDSVSTDTKINNVSQKTNEQVSAIFANAGKFLISAGAVFNTDMTEAVRNLQIPDLNIDIKGMTGEEAIKKINAVISTMGDQAAESIFGKNSKLDLLQYQKIGEGMLETVVRAAGDFGIFTTQLKQLQVDTHLSTAETVAFTEAMVKEAGDIKTLSANMDAFFSKFYTSAEQGSVQVSYLQDSLGKFNLQLPTTREGWKQLVDGQLALGTSSVRASNRLLELTDRSDAYYSAMENAQASLDSVGVSKTQKFAEGLTTVNNQFAALGVTMPTSVQGFKQLINGIDSSTQAGRLLHDRLMLLAPDVITLNTLYNDAQKETDALAKSQADYTQQLQILGVTAHDIPNYLSLVTTEFDKMAPAINALKIAAQAFLTDTQKTDMAQSYWSGQAQAALDSNPDLVKLGLKADMSQNDITKIALDAGLKNPWESYGTYVGGLKDPANDSLVKFISAISQRDIAGKNTAQDLASAASKTSTSATDSSAKDAETKAKALSDILQSVNDKLLDLGSSDVQKGLNAINKEIQDLIDKAKDNGGTIPNIGALKSAELSKYVEDFGKSYVDAYNRIGNSDLQNSIADIDEKFIKLNSDAQTLANNGLIDLGDALAKSGALKSDELRKATQGYATEFNNLGLTQYQQSLNALNKEFADLGRLAPADIQAIADAWGISVDQLKTDAQAIYDARKAALDKERDLLISNSNLALSRLKDTDYEGQLHSIADAATSRIIELYNKNASIPQMMHEAQNAIDSAVFTFMKARAAIVDNFKQIYQAIDDKRNAINDQITRLTSGDAAMIEQQRARAAADLATGNYDLQMRAIDTLQSLVMDNYQKQIDFVKNIKSYLDNLKLSDKSPLTNVEQLNEARAQWATQLAMANAGDSTARANITQSADAYLEKAQKFYASSSQYTAIFNQVVGALEQFGGTQDIATQQLQAANQSVAYLQNIAMNLENIRTQRATAEQNQLDALTLSSQTIGRQFIDNLQAMADAVGLTVNVMQQLSSPNLPTNNQPAGGAGGLITGNPVIAGGAGGGAYNPASDPATGLPNTVVNAPDPVAAFAADQGYGSFGFTTANLLDKFNAAVPSQVVAEHMDSFAKYLWNTAFGLAHITPPYQFATGAAFTNGIVSRPTNFNIGQMGEGGNSEGILPLANIGGKLGVHANTGSKELLAELRALRAEFARVQKEVEQLRKEQQEQTGAMIQSHFESSGKAADKVIEGAENTAKQTLWTQRNKPVIV